MSITSIVCNTLWSFKSLDHCEERPLSINSSNRSSRGKQLKQTRAATTDWPGSLTLFMYMFHVKRLAPNLAHYCSRASQQRCNQVTQHKQTLSECEAVVKGNDLWQQTSVTSSETSTGMRVAHKRVIINLLVFLVAYASWWSWFTVHVGYLLELLNQSAQFNIIYFKIGSNLLKSLTVKQHKCIAFREESTQKIASIFLSLSE